MKKISPSQRRLVLHHLITIREEDRPLFWSSYLKHRRSLRKHLKNPFIVSANLAQYDVARAKMRKHNIN